MAPEQIKQYPRRESDQYALAVVVYEWLTGKLPFSGTVEEIAIKHMTVEPPPLRHYFPDLTPGVEHVVLKALAKEPKERFPSVQEFALALEQAAQGGQDSSLLETPTHLLATPVAAPLTKVSESDDQASAASKEEDASTQSLDDQAIFTPSLVKYREAASKVRSGSVSDENTTNVPSRTTGPAIWQKWLALTSRLPSCWFALLGIVLFSVYFSIATNGAFFSSLNLSDLLAGSSIYGIISVGLTLTIIAGEFDLSAGSFACFAEVAFALLVVRYGWPFPLAIHVCLAACACSALALQGIHKDTPISALTETFQNSLSSSLNVVCYTVLNFVNALFMGCLNKQEFEFSCRDPIYRVCDLSKDVSSKMHNGTYSVMINQRV